MRETRRDALVADLQKALESAYDTGWECGTGDVMREVTAGKELASVIVQKVVAARDAEIRELLLSDGAVQAAYDALLNPHLADEDMSHIPEVLQAVAKHIGLGDGTGGQGS